MTGEIRVLSYNVLSLRMSYPAVVQVIRQCRPDVVCLQEIPRFFRWRKQLRRLAADCDLVAAAGHARAGAVALLTGPGVEILHTAAVKLPLRWGRHRRGAAVALLGVRDVRFAIASVHLSLYADERLAHLPLICAAAQRYGVPTVIAGDLNEEPDGAVWRALSTNFQDAYAAAPDGAAATFTAQVPRRRIDAVFVHPALKVAGCGVPDVAGVRQASDHQPLLARLSL